jgi:hypothetical protein
MIPLPLKAISANTYNTKGVKYLKDFVNGIMALN